jgi:hypothetical protein
MLMSIHVEDTNASTMAQGCRLTTAALLHKRVAATATLVKVVSPATQRARVKRLGQPSSSLAVRMVTSCQRSPTSFTSHSLQALSKSPEQLLV